MFKFVQKILQRFVLIELVLLGSIFAILGLIVLKINWTRLDGMDWAVLGLLITLAVFPFLAEKRAAKQKTKQDNSEQV